MNTTIIACGARSAEAAGRLVENFEARGSEDIDFLFLETREGRVEWETLAGELRGAGCATEIFSCQDQVRYLATRSCELAKRFAFESPFRLGAGVLRAWELGADRIILWGSDTGMGSEDVLSPHLSTGSELPLVQWGAASGWLNVFEEYGDNESVFPRGYPIEERQQPGSARTVNHLEATRIAVRSGAIAGEADVDGASRLDRRPSIRRPEAPQEGFALAAGTWCPFPAQNVSISRAAAPAYFLSPELQRYGAVWSSLVLQRIAGHLGESVTFGVPWVKRGEELGDAWSELDLERPGMRRTGEFALALRHLALRGTSYRECIAQVAAEMPFAWPQGLLRGRAPWNGYEVDWRKRFLGGLAAWVEAVETAQAKSTVNLFAALEKGRSVEAVGAERVA